MFDVYTDFHANPSGDSTWVIPASIVESTLRFDASTSLWQFRGDTELVQTPYLQDRITGSELQRGVFRGWPQRVY